MKDVNIKRLVFLFFTVVCIGTVMLCAGTPPVLEDIVLYGGPGDQRGEAIIISDDQVIAAGVDNVNNYTAVLVSFPTALTIPDWATVLYYRTAFHSVTASSTGIYPVGLAFPQACGASDGVGGTENKTMFSWFSSNGNLNTCRSENFFHYRGYEHYNDVTAGLEGSGAVYAAGVGEEMGWGGYRTVVARYASDGSLLWKRKFATDYNGNPIGGTYIRIGSLAKGITWHNDYLYVVGHDRNGTNIGGPLPKGMILKVDADSEPYDPNPNADGSVNLSPVWARWTEFSSEFEEVAGYDGFLYVVGARFDTTNNDDYLIRKYNEAGDIVWSVSYGGPGNDRLTGVTITEGRVFAVGYTESEGSGGKDLSVIEFEPNTGSICHSVLFGEQQDDKAYDATTDGTYLYVVGSSASFSQGGNNPGQSDLLLLRYSLGPSVLTAAIDVKPGSDSNPINPKAKGVIPVAILTTHSDDGDPYDFDATAVDALSVRFGPGGAAPVHSSGHIEDIDGDNDYDLMLHFSTPDTGIVCGDTTVQLTGDTIDGNPFNAEASISTVGCKKKK